MNALATLTRAAVRIGLGIVAALGLIAAIWTLQRAADVSHQQQARQATLEARQPAYRATASALASDASDAQLSANRGIVLLQQMLSTTTPDSILSAEPASEGLEATPWRD